MRLSHKYWHLNQTKYLSFYQAITYETASSCYRYLYGFTLNFTVFVVVWSL